jgi:hypothetical protein
MPKTEEEYLGATIPLIISSTPGKNNEFNAKCSLEFKAREGLVDQFQKYCEESGIPNGFVLHRTTGRVVVEFTIENRVCLRDIMNDLKVIKELSDKLSALV